MKALPYKGSILLAALVSLTGCASKLPRVLTDNTPSGMQFEEALDTSAIDFKVAATGETINLHDYMVQQDRAYLLLTFGSKDCAACNREAKHLKNEVIGQHPLFLTEPGKHFEIVGVNIDKESYQHLASYLTTYPFIKWADPAGKVMLDYFMPAGNKPSVPLVVMISRDGIAWRIMPNDSVSVTDIIRKVEKTLGITDQGDGGGDGSGDGSGSGTGSGSGSGSGSDHAEPEIPAIGLASVGPGRLKNVSAASCDGHVLTLDAALGLGDVRFVQVVAGNCGQSCQSNLSELIKTAAACDAGEPGGKSCQVASLQGGTTMPAECASGIAFKGGDEFFQVFKSFFNWNYKAIEDQNTYELSLPAVEGPLVLGFDSKGTVVFSKEGALAPGELKAAMAKAGFGAPARGPDFKLYSKARGEFGFADLRRQAQVTVVAADRLSTSFPCGPCEVELKKWSMPGDFMDWCKQNNNQCQLLVLENRALPQGLTMPTFFDLVQNGGPDPDDGMTPVASLHERGNYLPLIIDPKPGLDYLSRFYDGYMLGASPELPGGGRVFVYNQEGLLLAKYLTGDSAGGVDHVFEFVRSYLKN